MKRALFFVSVIILMLLCTSCGGHKLYINSELVPVKTGTSEGTVMPSDDLEPEKPSSLKYSFPVNGDGYTVDGYNYVGRTLVIPEKYDDGKNGEHPVYHIGFNAFRDCKTLKNITIPASVKNLYSNAFDGCRYLQTVTFSEQSELAHIHSNAFSGCSFLKSIEIPASVQAIETNAFADCKRLSDVRFAESSHLEYIGSDAFLNCSSLKSIILPNSLLHIENAFNGCNSLATITTPFVGTRKTSTLLISGETVVSEWTEGSPDANFGTATRNIKNIVITGGSSEANLDMSKVVISADEGTTVTLPARMTAPPRLNIHSQATLVIEEGGRFRAENNCIVDSDGTLLSVPWDTSAFPLISGVKKIGKNVFSQCKQYTDIALPDSVEDIDITAFNKTIVHSLAWIGNEEYLVENNSIIEKESRKIIWACEYSTIPENVRIIGKDVFSGMKIESIALPASVTEIEEQAFYNCENLASLSLPADSALTTIGIRAFSHCSKLTSFPAATCLEKIENYAFAYCKELSSFIFDSALNYIGNQGFCGTALTSVVLPDCVVSSECFCNCTELVSADISRFSGQYLPNSLFFGCVKLQEVLLNPAIVNIGYDCFRNCSSLTEITLPTALRYIDSHAFTSCSRLKNILIPVNVHTIMQNAFYGCSGLESFLFENTTPFYWEMNDLEKTNNPTLESHVLVDVTTTENNLTTFVKYNKIGYYQR